MKTFMAICLILIIGGEKASAQTAPPEAIDVNNENYLRIIGSAISDIVAPPYCDPNDPQACALEKDKNKLIKAKVEKKLKGEANEELLISLMSLGVHFTPTSSNELSLITSFGNSYLNQEMGAANSNSILANGLAQLELDVLNMDPEVKNVQIGALRKHMESLEILRTALEQKYARYQNYSLNDINLTQSDSVIGKEEGYFNKCETGNAASEGLKNIYQKLIDTENANQAAILALSTSIDNNLTSLGMPVTSSITDIDDKLLEPALTAVEKNKLNQIKDDKNEKAKRTAENAWIPGCKTQIFPYSNLLQKIKDEEDDYTVQTLDSIMDPDGKIPLPVHGTSYQNFSLAGSCNSPPPGFPLTGYLNQMKSDCDVWLNYYKSPFMDTSVAVDSTKAKIDDRYKELSNCGLPGRQCDFQNFNRIAAELEALGRFSMGRLLVGEMIKESISHSKQFYWELLYDPSKIDCQDIYITYEDKRDCYFTQKESPECKNGIGVDCERAEIGYLIYRLELESFKNNEKLATTKNLANKNNQATGFVGVGTGLGGPPQSGTVNSASSFAPPAAGGNAPSKVTTKPGLGNIPGTGVSTNPGAPENKTAQYLAPDPKYAKFAAKGGSANNFAVSKTLRNYLEKTYLKKSKLKSVKANRNKMGYADVVFKELASNGLNKLAGSYTAKEMLFASYIPKGGGAKQLEFGANKYKKELSTSLSSNNKTLSSGSGSSLMSAGALGKNSKKAQKKENKNNKNNKEEGEAKSQETDEKTKVSAAKKEESEALFNTISARYQKSLGRLGLSKDPLGGSIHAKKRNLFDIVSARYRKTEIYHDHSHRP